MSRKTIAIGTGFSPGLQWRDSSARFSIFVPKRNGTGDSAIDSSPGSSTTYICPGGAQLKGKSSARRASAAGVRICVWSAVIIISACLCAIP